MNVTTNLYDRWDNSQLSFNMVTVLRISNIISFKIYRCKKNKVQHVLYSLCTTAQMAPFADSCASECKFWPLTEFQSHCPYICMWFSWYTCLSLTSVHGCELMNMSRTAWSVIMNLCPAAWSGKAHLDSESCCQLLSPSPTLPLAHIADIL